MDSGPPASLRTPPQRGRSAYPTHLARAGEGHRVPLHRRGTSQKLECLEDLLREAGFKETRIFTPEVERAEAVADARWRQTEGRHEGDETGPGAKKSSRLLRFLSGIVSWSDAEGESDGRKVKNGHTKTQSLGRAAGKQKEILLNDDDERPEAIAASSDALVTPTPNRRKPFTPIIFASDISSPESASSTSSRSPPQFQRQSSHRTSNIYGKRQSERTRLDARSTLRHMISLPEFAPLEPSSRHPFLRRATEKPELHPTTRTRYRSSKFQQQTESETSPPLPQNWLSNVTNAVMNASGTGARIGRPQLPSQHARSHSACVSVRPVPDVQCSSEYVRRDETLARRGFAPRTPRAETTPVVVTAASVVCRSAPGSRSSSLVRGPSTDASTRGLARPQARRRDSGVPCLGVTTVQVGSTGVDSEVVHTYSHGQTGRFSTDEDEDYYDDSSDEGELDFARLLVPARRQHSIQSLRRNLHNHAVASAASGGGKVPPSAFSRAPKRTDSQLSFGTRSGYPSWSEALDDPEELLNSRHVSTDEDDEESILADWAAQGLPGLQNAGHKKRGTLPWTGVYAS